MENTKKKRESQRGQFYFSSSQSTQIDLDVKRNKFRRINLTIIFHLENYINHALRQIILFFSLFSVMLKNIIIINKRCGGMVSIFPTLTKGFGFESSFIQSRLY